jgi:hypothetical protein
MLYYLANSRTKIVIVGVMYDAYGESYKNTVPVTGIRRSKLKCVGR